MKTSAKVSNAFATIVTPSHVKYAVALYESLVSFDPSIDFYVLVVAETYTPPYRRDNLRYLTLADLQSCPNAKVILEKYKHKPSTVLRWSLKPVILEHLLRAKGYSRCFYVEWDLYFFSAFEHLYEELDRGSMLLTPHWRFSDFKNKSYLGDFTDGFFNAGFIGANSRSLAALSWWRKGCEEYCEKMPLKGLFDDQKYLDYLYLFFDGVRRLDHRGCNVAAWNRLSSKRSIIEGELRINEKWPIVFIHFTGATVAAIESGKDGLLKPLLEQRDQKVALVTRRYFPGQHQKERVLIYGLQGSGATLFAYLLAQKRNSIAVLDLWAEAARREVVGDRMRKGRFVVAPKLTFSKHCLVKATVGTQVNLSQHIERFEPTKVILFLRDPVESFLRIKRRAYAYHAGNPEDKLAILDSHLAKADFFDAIVKYEDLVRDWNLGIRTAKSIGWSLPDDALGFRRTPNQIALYNLFYSTWCRSHFVGSAAAWGNGNLQVPVNRAKVKPVSREGINLELFWRRYPNLMRFYGYKQTKQSRDRSLEIESENPHDLPLAP